MASIFQKFSRRPYKIPKSEFYTLKNTTSIPITYYGSDPPGYKLYIQIAANTWLCPSQWCPSNQSALVGPKVLLFMNKAMYFQSSGQTNNCQIEVLFSWTDLDHLLLPLLISYPASISLLQLSSLLFDWQQGNMMPSKDMSNMKSGIPC